MDATCENSRMRCVLLLATALSFLGTGVRIIATAPQRRGTFQIGLLTTNKPDSQQQKKKKNKAVLLLFVGCCCLVVLLWWRNKGKKEGGGRAFELTGIREQEWIRLIPIPGEEATEKRARCMRFRLSCLLRCCSLLILCVCVCDC